MSYQLVIAEKPSVARSIAGVIGATEKHNGYLQGNGYLVSWCIGHLVSFADAGRYDERFKKWRYEDLPILPEKWQYIIPDEKKQQFDILRSLMERPDVTGLVCATDAGREGELIFRFVYQMAGCKKPFKRLWISSMEDSVIKDIQFYGGCDGNLQGICSLVRGMKVEDVLPKIEGIRCGMTTTSCPDQLACALRQVMAAKK